MSESKVNPEAPAACTKCSTVGRCSCTQEIASCKAATSSQLTARDSTVQPAADSSPSAEGARLPLRETRTSRWQPLKCTRSRQYSSPRPCNCQLHAPCQTSGYAGWIGEPGTPGNESRGPTVATCITDLTAACDQGTLYARTAWAQPSGCPLQQTMAMSSPFADAESRLARARDESSKCGH